MIVAPSALVAIAMGEPEALAMTQAIQAEPNPKISAASYLELALVMDGRTSLAGRGRLDEILSGLGVEVVSFTPDQARVARVAHQQYGRGSGHPAKLNFGDCFSYALSVDTGEPLLFKGDDFAQTDVLRAL